MDDHVIVEDSSSPTRASKRARKSRTTTPNNLTSDGFDDEELKVGGGSVQVCNPLAESFGGFA